MSTLTKRITGFLAMSCAYLAPAILLFMYDGVENNRLIFLFGAILMLATAVTMFSHRLQKYAEGAAIFWILLFIVPFTFITVFLLEALFFE